MKKFMLAIALMAFGMTVSFAQNAPTAEKAKTKTSQKAKKPAAKTAKAMYECPMQCEPATDHAGKCGKCKMDLVAVKEKTKAKQH
jgi:tRNA/tmRNA/rRNA uracil-C5-methylase (TrmA/RlmC/RlmD family)